MSSFRSIISGQSCNKVLRCNLYRDNEVGNDVSDQISMPE